MDPNRWVGKDEYHGVPSHSRPDAPKAEHWSLRAIASVERPHDAVVAPDGSRVSFILDRDTSDVWTMPVEGGFPLRVTTGRKPMPFWEDDPATWSPDGKRLAYSDSGAVWVVAAEGGLPRRLVEGSSPIWLDNDTLVISVERDDESRLATCRADDPWPVAITPAGRNVSYSDADAGRLLYVEYSKHDRQRSDIWLLDLASGEERHLVGDPDAHARGAKLAPGGSYVAYTSEASGWYEIHVVGADGASPRQVTSDRSDFSQLRWHADSDRLLAVRTQHGHSDVVVVNISNGEIDVVAAGGSWADPHWVGEGVLAIWEDHANPARVVRIDRSGGIISLGAPPPAAIEVAPHVAYEEVMYSSFDGLEIHGFLFRPAGAEGPVGAIVYPHGGPTSVYGDEWDGHGQYFVDKGYAWFAINFRGSTGYGRDFERANHGVWGLADTKDCLAAADFLASLAWVDERRIAIYGASYGSYMALTALAMDRQHRFACGVAKYGDSDIATSWSTGDRGGREDLERMMGTPAENRQAYWDGSPLWSVVDIEVPILVAHGEQDARVDPGQSTQLVTELRRHDKTFEYLTYPTEAHGLLRADPQVHFYQRLERFLDWHLM
ncbi:MAG: prolyl oligopeptidase family serine peptidase [Acidimicrobiia bacterium]